MCKAFSCIVDNIQMRDNSAETWNGMRWDNAPLRDWLVSHGLSDVFRTCSWSDLPSCIRNDFIDWYRSNHNV